MSDEELTQDETQEERDARYRANEPDLLRALLSAAHDEETYRVNIVRKGETIFSFRVRPLKEREFDDCHTQATKTKAAKSFGGLKVPVEIDTARYRSLVIHLATVEEDRKAMWNNKELQLALNVLSGPDVIDAVLRGGEKDAVFRKIEEISGYGEDLVDEAKN